jgi:hypothetical protein
MKRVQGINIAESGAKKQPKIGVKIHCNNLVKNDCFDFCKRSLK